MPKIKCPECKKNFSVSGRYDDDFDRKVICEKCGFVSTMFSFEYAGRNSFDINSENVIDPVYIDFEIATEKCDSSV